MDDWLVFNENADIFGSEAKKNCLCKFDDGTVIRYKDEHPFAILTHFKLTTHNTTYQDIKTSDNCKRCVQFQGGIIHE